MRPEDIVIAGPVQQMPPCCPACLSLLHAINQNAAGDVLFECLSDGYMAVHRREQNKWEQRPGSNLIRWAPPVPINEAKRRAERRAV
jgi:hypothetical protein